MVNIFKKKTPEWLSMKFGSKLYVPPRLKIFTSVLNSSRLLQFGSYFHSFAPFMSCWSSVARFSNCEACFLQSAFVIWLPFWCDCCLNPLSFSFTFSLMETFNQQSEAVSVTLQKYLCLANYRIHRVDATLTGDHRPASNHYRLLRKHGALIVVRPFSSQPTLFSLLTVLYENLVTFLFILV